MDLDKLFLLRAVRPLRILDGYNSVWAISTDGMVSKKVVLLAFGAQFGEDADDTEYFVESVVVVEDRVSVSTLYHCSGCVSQLEIFRVVSDAIMFIEMCDPSTLVQDLADIGCGCKEEWTKGNQEVADARYKDMFMAAMRGRNMAH
jgi:hypothetical protein